MAVLAFSQFKVFHRNTCNIGFYNDEFKLCFFAHEGCDDLVFAHTPLIMIVLIQFRRNRKNCAEFFLEFIGSTAEGSTVCQLHSDVFRKNFIVIPRVVPVFRIISPERTVGTFGNGNVVHGNAFYDRRLYRNVGNSLHALIRDGKLIFAAYRPRIVILIVPANNAGCIRIHKFLSRSVLVCDLKNNILHKMMRLVIEEIFKLPVTAGRIKLDIFKASAGNDADAFHLTFHNVCGLGDMGALIPDLKFVFTECPRILKLIAVNGDSAVISAHFIKIRNFFCRAVFIGYFKQNGIGKIFNMIIEERFFQLFSIVFLNPISRKFIVFDKFGCVCKRKFNFFHRRFDHGGVCKGSHTLIGNVEVVIADSPRVMIKVPLCIESAPLAGGIIKVRHFFAGTVLIVYTKHRVIQHFMKTVDEIAVNKFSLPFIGKISIGHVPFDHFKLGDGNDLDACNITFFYRKRIGKVSLVSVSLKIVGSAGAQFIV